MKSFIIAAFAAVAFAQDAPAAETPAATTEENVWPKVSESTAWTGAPQSETSKQVLTGKWWIVQSTENLWSLHFSANVRSLNNVSTVASWVLLEEKPDERIEASVARLQSYYDNFIISQSWERNENKSSVTSKSRYTDRSWDATAEDAYLTFDSWYN